MTTVSRRTLLAAATASALFGASTHAKAASARATSLKSITAGVPGIAAQEHAARVARVQASMRQRKIGALLLDAGSTLAYFTGVRWPRSERTTAALIPADGDVVIVMPFFEEPSVRETLQIAADVRPWKEDESPFALLARALGERAAAEGPLAIEATTRFFIIDSMTRTAGIGRSVVPGEDLVQACRMRKTAAELALLQAANNVTIAALRHVHRQVDAGMRASDIRDLMTAATEALGGSDIWSLVLLNEASAYPHGSIKPQTVRKGSMILIDTGCAVHGYQSDISRSWVFGEPSSRQRDVWSMVKRGQEIALETARIGSPVGLIDEAVRTFYEDKGWTKNYGLPGLSHRTGHGIGMDGHEAPYLVRSDVTPLEAGMCFSDEPGIYIPGEFGVRLEDCWFMTEHGPQLFTPLAKSIEQPI